MTERLLNRLAYKEPGDAVALAPLMGTLLVNPNDPSLPVRLWPVSAADCEMLADMVPCPEVLAIPERAKMALPTIDPGLPVAAIPESDTLTAVGGN